MTMKTNIQEITIKVNIIAENERKHPNILANAFVTFKEDGGGYITISGFTVWRSKHGGYNVTYPRSNTGFQFCRSEPGFWKRLKSEIIDTYERAKIPIID